MSDIIHLISSKTDVFIWNADDWLKLRRDHRIIGELVGSVSKSSRQDVFTGLPLLLLPEEVNLLLEKEIARLIKCTCLQQPPNESLYEKFQQYRDMLFSQQVECLRENRKKQIVSMMDKIIEGKKRKMLGLDTSKKNKKQVLDKNVQEALDKIEIDSESLLKQELTKLPELTRNEALIQTHTTYPWLNENDIEKVEWKYPVTSDQQLRYRIYKDLWEKGYYITGGEKFGGDFLVYPGDPIMFHSQFVVQCKYKDEEMPITELVAQCRIACHVRKTLVFATYCEKEARVKYQSFQWAESNTLAKV